MYEVTNDNFKKTLPKVEMALQKAAYISFDLEFSGLKSTTRTYSLFDSVKERYETIKEDIKPFAILQFGISTFRRDSNSNNTYKAKAFNFFLMPRSIPSKNRQFTCQVSALEFLSLYKFDFNKAIYQGISYLNEADEADLQRQIDDKTLQRNVEQYMSYKEGENVKEYINKVADWLNKQGGYNEPFKIAVPSPILQYILHKELRKRFRNIWTVASTDLITVMKVTPDLREVLQQEEGSVLENVLVDSFVGFSKVFKMLVNLKKPLVGHNIFLDLMFMYQQFYRTLPKTYSDFKSEIHELFPVIYDTKCLSFELRRLLSKEEKWKANSVGDLYTYFTSGQGRHLIMCSPQIAFSSKVEPNVEDCHIAGWDAYFTGFAFIRMAHVFAVKQYGEGLEQRDITNTEITNAIKGYVNCINVIRGNVLYLKLDGPDPETSRPQWLYVKPLKQPINTSQIAETFSRFGVVDVKPLTSKRALVAVSSYESAKDILQHFKQHNDFYVVPYSPLRHSPSLRIALWGGVSLLSGGMFVWMLHRTFHKST